MYIICKVKPDRNHCMACIDMGISHNALVDCKKCMEELPECILVSTNTAKFLGDASAVVCVGDHFEEVELDRVIKVKCIPEGTV